MELDPILVSSDGSDKICWAKFLGRLAGSIRPMAEVAFRHKSEPARAGRIGTRQDQRRGRQAKGLRTMCGERKFRERDTEKEINEQWS